MSFDLKKQIEDIRTSSKKEEYERKAEQILLKSGDGDFTTDIYLKIEPTAILECIKNIHQSKRDEIERKEKESKFDASRMLVTLVFSLENGFFDLLNGLVSFGQICLVKKIMEKIESHHDSVSSPQIAPESGSVLASGRHSSQHVSVSSSQMQPESRSILASRPHSSHQDSVSSSQIPPESGSVLASRPQSLTNIFDSLNDLLSADDVEKSMDVLLNQKSAKIIIEKLEVKSPRFHQLIHIPIILNLVAMLINEDDRDVWTYLTTSKLFYKLIETFQLKAHHDYGLDVDGVKVLYRKLAEMAFEKTNQGSVVFKHKDLKKHSLSKKRVQDFLFKFILSKQNTVLPFGLGMSFKFKHKYLQEFFTVFAAIRLPVDEFQEFVGKLFPRLENKDGLVVVAGEDSFAIIRVLIIGWVNEMKTLVLDGEEIMRKKQIFLDQLRSHIKQLFVEDVYQYVRYHQRQMMFDMYDFRDEDICNDVKEQLKDVNFSFEYYRSHPLYAAAHREAFFHSLQRFSTKVRNLRLYICDWKDEEIRKLFQSIQSSTVKIEKMWIYMHPQQLLDMIDHVIASFPHITRKLELWLLGEGKRRFCRKFKEEIINFDTSKLQTQMLEVKVYDVSISAFLLHVELHRGKSPRIILIEISNQINE